MAGHKLANGVAYATAANVVYGSDGVASCLGHPGRGPAARATSPEPLLVQGSLFSLVQGSIPRGVCHCGRQQWSVNRLAETVRIKKRNWGAEGEEREEKTQSRFISINEPHRIHYHKLANGVAYATAANVVYGLEFHPCVVKSIIAYLLLPCQYMFEKFFSSRRSVPRLEMNL